MSVHITLRSVDTGKAADNTIVAKVAATRTFVGNLDYCAFSGMTGEPVQEMQVDFTRTHIAGGDQRIQS